MFRASTTFARTQSQNARSTVLKTIEILGKGLMLLGAAVWAVGMVATIIITNPTRSGVYLSSESPWSFKLILVGVPLAGIGGLLWLICDWRSDPD